MDKIEDKIKEVMAAVFEVPYEQINESSSQDNIDSWDSLKHMNLVLAIEEQFSITLDDNEIVDMCNYNLIKEIIETH